jgi:predicted unusual protein kinase regulating ubiquinone biosynthesis (AarF/ABC1/UbiB family)
MDAGELSEELCRAYLQQIMVDGFFHADPHPGNVLLTDDCRLALLDLGMVAAVAPRMQERLLKLVIAVSEGRGDEAGAALLQIGRPGPNADSMQARDEIARQVTGFQGRRTSDNALGRMLFEAVNVASQAGYRMPSDLTLLAKALLNLDEVGRHLDPDFDPNASIRRNVTRIARRRMLKSLSLGKMLAGTYETKEFLEKLPRRLNQLFENVAENRVSFRIDALNEAVLMEGMQKVANRITMGLVISAMVVGAALMMRVETRFRILGYPGIAILLFLFAAITGVFMVVNILFSDIRADKARLRKGGPSGGAK